MSDSICLKHLTAEPAGMQREDRKLEYLGDAVIAVAIRDYFVNTYPKLHLRAYGEVISTLCSNRWLGQMASKHGMTCLGGSNKGMANRFEAFIGEIYQKYGFDSAKAYVWGMLAQYYKPKFCYDIKKFDRFPEE